MAKKYRLTANQLATKNWLNRGYKIKETINALEDARLRAFDIATNTTSALTERVQESNGNGTENKLITYCDYSRMIENDKSKLILTFQKIENAIMSVQDNTLRILLIRRYLNFETWESIACAMNYSYKHVVNVLHRKSLEEIEKIKRCNRM